VPVERDVLVSRDAKLPSCIETPMALPVNNQTATNIQGRGRSANTGCARRRCPKKKSFMAHGDMGADGRGYITARRRRPGTTSSLLRG